MTALLTRHEPDQPGGQPSMPGWNVVADLTPPELINSRWIAVLRRRVVLSLVLIVLLCVAGYVAAERKYSAASDSADAASTQTIGLQHDTTKYAPITRLESAVDSINGQIATSMATDVDVARLAAKVRDALPNSMSITSLSLTLAPSSTASAGLDASGHTVIGQLTIAGTGRTLNDLPSFVDRLSAITGLSNIVPNSNQVNDKSTQFAVTTDLTDQLYSHHFDLVKTGGK